MSRLGTAKRVIKENIKDAECGIYYGRNAKNDIMTNICAVDGVYIDICYDCEYFEVFGLTKEEFNDLKDYYLELLIDKCVECPYVLLDYETYYGTAQKQYFVAGCKKNKTPENCKNKEDKI